MTFPVLKALMFQLQHLGQPVIYFLEGQAEAYFMVFFMVSPFHRLVISPDPEANSLILALLLPLFSQDLQAHST